MPDLTLPRLADDGTTTLDTAITATDTSIALTGAQFTELAEYFPLSVLVAGELIEATGISSQVLTGCIRSVNGVVKAHAAGARCEISYPFRLGLGSAGLGPGVTIVEPDEGGGGGGGEEGATPAPTIPTFSGAPTQITAGSDVAAIIAAGAEGDHFLLLAGAHDIEDARLKTNMHVRFATGASADGTGKGYCFRPESQSTTGVAIGGDPSGARPLIANYGNGTTAQGYGAIMGRNDDILGSEFVYQDTDDWFIYHLELEENSSNGVFMGSNWTVYDCEIHGHEVTGIGGDRIVGGLIHSNILYWNALNPASGVGSNGANIKLTWVNADAGRTSITPIDRTKAQLVISSNTVEGDDRNAGTGNSRRGIWLDLDCQDVLIEYNDVDDHDNLGIFAEGCNNIEIAYNTVRRTDGFGDALGANFINGAICNGESTNVYTHHNTLEDCERALINRLSNRTSDWLDPAGSANYGYSAGPRYWILDTTTIPAVSGQSNIWTGGNTFEANVLVNCGRVVINEGTNGGGQTVQGATDLTSIDFIDNDYSQSPSIDFYEVSNTALDLAAWQALANTRDQ